MFAVNLRFFFTIDVYRNVINWKRDASKHVTQEAAWRLSLFWQMAVDFTRYTKTKQSNYFLKNIAGINKNTTVIERRHWLCEEYLLE